MRTGDKFKKQAGMLRDYIQRKSLRFSEKRLIILEAFLESDRHLTADELYAIVRKKDPTMGIATIYRTLQIFTECGISGELALGDTTARYYPTGGKAHHDHLICLRCGRVVNIVSTGIEKTQERLARKNGFLLESHRLDLFGVCGNCRKKK